LDLSLAGGQAESDYEPEDDDAFVVFHEVLHQLPVPDWIILILSITASPVQLMPFRKNGDGSIFRNSRLGGIEEIP
jgi:hypothetical protein